MRESVKELQMGTDTQLFERIKMLADPERCALHERRINEFGDIQAAHLARTVNIEKLVEKLNKKLFEGNGDPAFITSHALLEKAVIDHLADHKARKEDKRWGANHIIALAIALFVLLVGAVLTHRSEARMDERVQILERRLKP